MDALGFGLREEFGEGAQSFRMRMANGNGLFFFVCILEGEFQLTADCADLLNIIEKRHIAEGARNASSLSAIEGDGGGGGAAVDEEEMAMAENGHEFGHQLGIGSGERALMIVHPDGVGHGREHRVQGGGNLRGRHTGTQFLGFGGFVGQRFHGEMEHDLIAAATGLLRNLSRAGMVREDGKRQRVVEREDGISNGRVGGDIVKNNGKARPRNHGMRRRRVRRMASFGGAVGMNEGIVSGFDLAAARNRKSHEKQENAETQRTWRGVRKDARAEILVDACLRQAGKRSALRMTTPTE